MRPPRYRRGRGKRHAMGASGPPTREATRVDRASRARAALVQHAPSRRVGHQRVRPGTSRGDSDVLRHGLAPGARRDRDGGSSIRLLGHQRPHRATGHCASVQSDVGGHVFHRAGSRRTHVTVRRQGALSSAGGASAAALLDVARRPGQRPVARVAVVEASPPQATVVRNAEVMVAVQPEHANP
jgi:hypothetical protein